MSISKRIGQTSRCGLLFLLAVSGLSGLTPEEADGAIRRGLAASSIRSARDYFEVTQFSSRLGHAQKFARARSSYEYSLLIRSCRQLLRFAAFQSKKDRTIDLDEIRSSCLNQDRIWVAVDEGSRNEASGGTLKRVMRTSGLRPYTAPTDIAVELDGESILPIIEIQLDELGPGSAVAVFPVKPFQHAAAGEITIRINKDEQVSATLRPELLRRLFAD